MSAVGAISAQKDSVVVGSSGGPEVMEGSGRGFCCRQSSLMVFTVVTLVMAVLSMVLQFSDVGFCPRAPVNGCVCVCHAMIRSDSSGVWWGCVHCH